MRLSKALIDMEMADYSAALDPAYTTLEFENMQVLAMGYGESPLFSPLHCGGTSWGLPEEKSLGWSHKCSEGGQGCQMGRSQQFTGGFLLPPGENRGGRAELCLVQVGWCPAAQSRALGSRHTPGAGWNERSPPDIQPRERGWG